MKKSVYGLAVGGILFCSSVALAAANASDTCQAAKLKLTAKYGSCRLNAESKAVKTGDPVSYSKCSLAKFEDAEINAANDCPTIDDQSDISARVTADTNAIAELLGGDYPVDPYFPASGQTSTYGPGDDGNVRAGATLAYTDNGDGTITDRNTGLMWEKKVAFDDTYATAVSCTDETGTCANPHNANNEYVWTVNGSPYTGYNGAVVTIFLNQLNNRCNNDTTVSCTVDADCSVPGGACGFAGHRDWRLPQIKELVSIVDYSIPSPGPAVNAVFDGASCGLACTDITNAACSCTANSGHWSASTFASGTNRAWYVFFFNGGMDVDNKTNSLFVRAVRGGF